MEYKRENLGVEKALRIGELVSEIFKSKNNWNNGRLASLPSTKNIAISSTQ